MNGEEERRWNCWLNEWMNDCMNKQVSVPRTGPPLRGEIKSSQVQFLSIARRWLQRKMPWKPHLYRRFNRILQAFSILRISPKDQHIRCPCHHPESKKNLLVFFLFLLPFLLVLLSSFPLFLLSFLPFFSFSFFHLSLLTFSSEASGRKDSVPSAAMQL